MKMIFSKLFFLLTGSFIGMLFLISFHTTAYAAGVSAKIYKEDSTHSIIEIYAGKTAPATLIVQMFLPSGQTITESDPQISKFDGKKNSAKWLLREVGNGQIRISVYTSKPLDLEDTIVSIRYRNKKTGNIIEVEAVKK